MRRHEGTDRNERGAMLIEVLVALLILLVIMVGVMQLFATALVSDRGSDARTELSFKAQQTVEVIRMANAVVRTAGGTVPANLTQAKTGLSLPISNTVSYRELPSGSNDAYWDFWGPNGTGVIDQANPRYVIGYEIVDGDANGSPGTWLIRVVARPRNAGSYLDVRRNKVVRYVAAIPK